MKCQEAEAKEMHICLHPSSPPTERKRKKKKGGGGRQDKKKIKGEKVGKKSFQYARGILKKKKNIFSFVSKLSLMAASPAAPSVSCITDLTVQVTSM